MAAQTVQSPEPGRVALVLPRPLLTAHGHLLLPSPTAEEQPRTTDMTPLDIVLAWVAAVNARDVARALELTAADFEVHGPRGTRRGHLALREWIEGTPIDMQTRRAFARGGSVVLRQAVTWRDAKGFAIGEGVVAHHFTVADGRVATLTRYDDLDAALRAAGLEADDQAEVADIDA